MSCSRDSTEQGPAITTRSGPPMSTPLTSTTVRCGCSSRLTSVNGCEMEIMSATPGRDAERFDFLCAGRDYFQPRRTTVRSAPRIRWGKKPHSLTLSDHVLNLLLHRVCRRVLMIIENLLFQNFPRAGNKKAANPVGFRGQSGNLFALSTLSLYLDTRAIRPWPLPTHGKRYVKENQ